ERVAILSYELWRDRYASDPSVIGKLIRYYGQPLTVIGVAPALFAGRIDRTALWIPYTLEPSLLRGRDLLHDRESGWLRVAGRLNAGHSRADVQAELALLARQQDSLH